MHLALAHLHVHMCSVISHNGHCQQLKSLIPVPCLGKVGQVITLPLYAWVHANVPPLYAWVHPNYAQRYIIYLCMNGG
jgi:hypothetical protein